MKLAAGTLLYRKAADEVEVLLVHPSGNYNRHKPWSIPKGEAEPNENHLEITARRETAEEAGVTAGDLVALGHADYRKSGKRVYCFAGPAPADANPHPASWEIDQVRFFSIGEARKILHPDQCVFLDRLAERLA
jgi:predicted NUDIX family NTP pyrophosphohydrolase